MHEMRKNPITDTWTIIASERANRPHFAEEHKEKCCFCYGNEDLTPPEVLVHKKKGDISSVENWQVRVFPNKFPAFNSKEEFLIKEGAETQLYSYARGKAEVIIETPIHSQNIALLSQDEIELILKTYQKRYISLSQDEDAQYVIIFRNNGIEAGASIAHPHSQIISMPVIPINIVQELEQSKKYYEANKKCLFCELIKTELEQKKRIIFENSDFVGFIPYASRCPFESWIAPKFHSDSFEHLTVAQLKNLSEVWKAVLLKLHLALDNPAYNYYIHTSPVHQETSQYYHWHMELIPKITNVGGFELGTGMNINTSSPEENAAILQKY